MTLHGFFRRKTIRCAIFSFFIMSSICSCAHYGSDAGEEKDSFEVRIETAEDVKKLDRLETVLTVTPEKAAIHPDYQVIQKMAVPFVPEYRMGPGDVVEVVYHIRYDEMPDNYRLEVEDKISVQFPYHPQFSSTVLVRTDGKITMPIIGDVYAEGKTPMELARILNEKYSEYLAKPSITVALEEFNVKIRELKRAITTAPRGQSKIAPITPDGKISFPVIGQIQAEGLTVSQLEKEVNRRYKEHVRYLNATIILHEINSPKLYVFGEVQRPGALDMKRSMTLLEALAIANGQLNSADLGHVVIFRNEGLERPIAFKVNLASALAHGNAAANIRLKPADIIYVPKSGLDSFNDMMAKIFTKGIYTILPFTTDYNWNYRIDGNTAVR